MADGLKWDGSAPALAEDRGPPRGPDAVRTDGACAPARGSGSSAAAGLRILHMCHTSRNAGNGTVNLAVALAIGQAAAGATVGYLHARGGFAELMRERGVETFALGDKPVLRVGWRAGRETWRAIRRFRPDIVHYHMGVNCLLGSVVRLASPRFRAVATVHRAFAREAKVMRLADHVIALTDGDARTLVERGFRSDRVTRIHNGRICTDPSPAGALAPALTLRSPSVLTVAGLYDRKGIAELIAAIDIVRTRRPDVRLYLAGDGPDRAKFEAMVAQRALEETVTFLGFQDDPGPLYRQADVFVLASHAEGLPLVLLEARAAGCAVIATDVDGNREALAGGEAGRLVPVRDPERLAAAIAAVLEDPAERAALQEQAVAGLDYWTVERMVGETLALYHALAADDTAS